MLPMLQPTAVNLYLTSKCSGPPLRIQKLESLQWTRTLTASIGV